MPAFYNHFVNNTLSKMAKVSSVSEFLLTEWNAPLTHFHNGTQRQQQTSLSWNGDYYKWSPPRHEDLREPTDIGLDVKYKQSLLKTLR